MGRNKYVSPSTSKAAFNCPYCGTFSLQTWYSVFLEIIADDIKLPSVFLDQEKLSIAYRNNEIAYHVKEDLMEYARKLDTGLVFIENVKANYTHISARNAHFSVYYNCQKVAVWVHNKLVFPPELQGEEPNPDIPDDILQDYEEARSVLNLSPRGSAALLRLVVQKLCKHLGEKGKKIDDDIASLVKKGLNPLVQQALDAVRVIGNEAVHPGSMDLRDDRDTASELLSLVNLIVEQMISQPKRVNDVYNRLPPDKRAAIEKRDAKKP